MRRVAWRQRLDSLEQAAILALAQRLRAGPFDGLGRAGLVGGLRQGARGPAKTGTKTGAGAWTDSSAGCMMRYIRLQV
jgi:hypothetical protein